MRRTARTDWNLHLSPPPTLMTWAPYKISWCLPHGVPSPGHKEVEEGNVVEPEELGAWLLPSITWVTQRLSDSVPGPI